MHAILYLGFPWHFRYILSLVLEDFRRAGVIHDCLSTFLGDILIVFSGENVSKAHLSVSINLVPCFIYIKIFKAICPIYGFKMVGNILYIIIIDLSTLYIFGFQLTRVVLSNQIKYWIVIKYIRSNHAISQICIISHFDIYVVN